ncbi:MAG: type II secretion system protein [Elusimicrobia bacterium]|nr:type II secretion system protein [Elusimicrobiota bacterium]
METKKGFTLIELMIVVAIIGILAAIAIPKFADLIRKSKEGSTKGSLGALRSALTIYYGEMEGAYPIASVDGLANSEGVSGAPVATFSNIGGPFLTKYLDSMPSVKLGISNIGDTADIVYFNGLTAGAFASFSSGGGHRGKWWYCGSGTGEMHIGVTDTDTKGSCITSW